VTIGTIAMSPPKRVFHCQELCSDRHRSRISGLPDAGMGELPRTGSGTINDAVFAPHVKRGGAAIDLWI